MAGMGAIGRAKRRTNPGLTLVHGGQQASSDEPDELAELRQMFAAAGAPDEVLRALTGSGDPEEILRRLVDDGRLPSDEESLAELLNGWRPLLKPGCGPFDAELAGAEFLGLMFEATPDAADLPDMLVNLIGQAEAYGGPVALAMLRVLAVMAPPQVRPTAAEAADRLVSGGLTDRPWAKRLGAPELGPCFGYSDGFAQETLAITFR